MDEHLRELIEEKICNKLASAGDGEIEEISIILGVRIPEGRE